MHWRVHLKIFDESEYLGTFCTFELLLRCIMNWHAFCTVFIISKRLILLMVTGFLWRTMPFLRLLHRPDRCFCCKYDSIFFEIIFVECGRKFSIPFVLNFLRDFRLLSTAFLASSALLETNPLSLEPWHPTCLWSHCRPIESDSLSLDFLGMNLMYCEWKYWHSVVRAVSGYALYILIAMK